ncbi:MAG: HEXXH motif-containing putative peptide modification protein [Spirosomaceae bacterium]|jgi:hypothetical protein|nr:HEXXH motif-containing putative peptide modification protein [Spirosomataceae bacterium]
MLKIEKKLFTSQPFGESARLLRLNYQKLLLVNLQGYFDSIDNLLKIDLSEPKAKLDRLNVERRFSPLIYSIFTKLSKACQEKNLTNAIDSIHQINISPENCFYNDDFDFTTILTERWEDEFVNRIRNENVPNKSNETLLILPILNKNLTHYVNIYNDLNKRLANIDFELKLEIDYLVSRLKLFNGKSLKAATSASIFGAIYLKLPPKSEDDFTYFADHIIHETSHLTLDILLSFDKIVLNENHERFKAPIRIDPRPMFGIFHATFVLSRMVRIFQRLAQESKEKAILERLGIFKRQFNEGLETVEKYAVLSDNGKQIKDSLVLTAEI